MMTEKRSTRFGAAMIIFAILLRLFSGIWAGPVRAIRQNEASEPEGMLLRPTAGATTAPETQTSIPQTVPPDTQPQPTQPPAAVFSQEDLAAVRVQYAADCSYRPDLQPLLLQPLYWDLSGSEPTVLIVHSHASESYTRQSGQDYTESADFRTLDPDYNMIAVGDYLTELLTNAGICVLHDRQIHDYPSYTAAYSNSRASVQWYLSQYPSIQVVLDLHRDAAENADGSQYATAAVVNGQQVAQLMLVVGTNASGNYHPNWKDNLATALKLQVLMEKAAPGITRQTIVRAQRFNHDLSTGALLVEVGTAGNTLQEAMGAIPVLADALAQLIRGANT